MRAIIIALLLITCVACKRNLSHTEIENQLKSSMHKYLINRKDYDPTKLKYDVQKVDYFEDKDFFECEFVVHLTAGTHDTTGIMTARITKDFSKVSRKL